MDIKFYNSLTNSVQTFKPLHDGKVSMYVCGPTVYNYPHIGNMRPVVVFDILRRFLTYVGYEVTYVSNFTDVDDKIINAAQKEGKTEKELTEYYIQQFKETSQNIGSMIPSITPKVTEYIPMIIKYIEELVNKGAAYVRGGDVYFRVSKIKDYGALSGINTDDLIAGARIEENSEKESPLDFALWKETSVGINWESPWGRGRPGWHTECTVMIDTIFKDHFIDIHGGGYDLKFPHHENEIAQAEAMHGNKIANYWMHNAFVNFGDTKMSKSLGNVIYAKDMIEKYGGPVTRLVILNTHYRMPVNYTEDTIEAAKQEINKMTFAYKQINLLLQVNGYDLNSFKPLYIDKFILSLADDLNTANALMELYSLVKEANQLIRSREIDFEKLGNISKTLTDMFFVLGLDIPLRILDKEELKMYEDYLNLKKEKRFEESDVLRDQLMKKGIL